MILAVIISSLSLCVSASEAVQTGTCGESVVWTLDGDGTFTVSGKGEMTNYDIYGNFVPYNISLIKSIVIEEGVTNIGDYAFAWCENLSTIQIADSVKHIGENSFFKCGYYEDESNWDGDVLYIGSHLICAKKTT